MFSHLLLQNAYAIYGIAGVLFFVLWPTTEIKKRIFPFYMMSMVLGGIAYAYFVTHSPLPLVGAPTLALIAYMHMRREGFCVKCRTATQSEAFSRPDNCRRCGAYLPDEI